MSERLTPAQLIQACRMALSIVRKAPMSDTPRTDAAEDGDHNIGWVPAAFARELELELAGAYERAATLCDKRAQSIVADAPYANGARNEAICLAISIRALGR